MHKICIFAGTTEGRKLAEFLGEQDAELTVCTATEYGGELLRDAEHLRISDRRLDFDEIRQMLEENRFDLVIDATHPYAVQVSRNISEACGQTGTDCCRLVRQRSGTDQDSVTVPDAVAAAEFLNTTEGNILLTTGSKEIDTFASVRGFSERIYARVLPVLSSIEACTEAGLSPSHIIAMQGPFSEEMNIAMLRSVTAEWLVTKESGTTGGFIEKANAAAKLNIKMLVIGRPEEQSGMNEAEMYTYLRDRFGFTCKTCVTVAGIGPGSTDTMTAEVRHAIDQADCLIGAARMLRAASHPGRVIFEAIDPDLISSIIASHPEFHTVTVLMSGDSGFFSGTKRLLQRLSSCDVRILPGISSLSYLCARIGISTEDITCVSLHGRNRTVIPAVRSRKKVFVLTGGENTVRALCEQLCASDLGSLLLTIGEDLSYPDEKITRGTAAELRGKDFSSLSVVLIENDHPDAVVTHGLPDEIFERSTGAKGVIPMTKQEIRSVCLSALQLKEDAVCWDIGAGSGSVAIEMALQAKNGKIYAVEQDRNAAELIRRNSQKLGAENLTVVEGIAPDVCTGLPTPTHVFIGGCSGNIRDLISVLSERESDIHICAAAVSLETIEELSGILHDFQFAESETIMIQTAKSRTAGNHRLMIGGNPVWIFMMHLSGAQE